MIVITLTKVPQSLRGDLTKWCQEIQTGVYVGNVSARIRDQLWDRIMRDCGNGQATMVFNAQNELGYQIKTTRTDYQVMDFDGIPLVKRLNKVEAPIKHGFSNAAKWRKIQKFTKKEFLIDNPMSFIALDVETTGLDVTKDQIISIGAVKKGIDGTKDNFYVFVKSDTQIPKNISQLTGITNLILESEGIELAQALLELKEFADNVPIVGYNLSFDDNFISTAFKKLNIPRLSNELIDLMPIIKKNNKFLDNYKLSTVLDKYKIKSLKPHESLSDADATMKLAEKLIKNGDLSF